MTDHKLRPMTKADLVQVLAWRNHPDVRRYMYTNHEIGLDEHQAWFARVSDDPAVHLLIYENCGRASGFVNITRGRSPTVADWGFYLSPDSERGTGRSLGREALKYAFSELCLHKICGQALGFNERSIAFHKALGFTEEGCLRDQHFDGAEYHDVVCFGLLDHEWQAQAKELNDE